MITSFILLPILLCLSGMLSSSETVLFGLTKFELHECRRADSTFRRLAAELMDHPRRVLLTILIGNTTVNILIFASSFVISEQLAVSSPVLASLWGLVTVVLVIIIGEVLAKTVAIGSRHALAPVAAGFVRVLVAAFMPLRIIMDLTLVTPLSRLLVSPHSDDNVGVEELHALVELSEEQGILGGAESDMLQEVLALDTINVRSIMVPRVDVVGFDLAGTREELLQVAHSYALVRIPVYRENIDALEGIIHVRHALLTPHDPLESLIKKVHYVPEQMAVDRLLAHFRNTASQVAIVVDEYGGVAGLVTLEDVVELIVGDIGDHGEDDSAVEQLDERTYRLSGHLGTRAWASLFNLSGTTMPRVTTMGGLVAARLGRLPREGEVIQIGNLRVIVEKMSGRRVRWLRVELAGDSNA